MRVEFPPAEEAQVDFGAAGRLRDPRTSRMRKAWMFVMTLSYSRHCYVEFVFDQTVSTCCAVIGTRSNGLMVSSGAWLSII